MSSATKMLSALMVKVRLSSLAVVTGTYTLCMLGKKMSADDILKSFFLFS